LKMVDYERGINNPVSLKAKRQGGRWESINQCAGKLNSFTPMRVRAGNKTPALWDSYGRNSIESTVDPTQLFHKHHHRGGAV
jgi:hypothetical protein